MENITDKARESGIGRKTVLVGFIVAVLLIGGSVYAWQYSVLKDSIGGVVQMGLLDEKTKEFNPVATPRKDSVSKDSVGVVSREKNQVVRTSDQFLEVVYPNGGEELCLGESFSIKWRHKGVTSVRVVLQSASHVYDLGVAESAEGILKDALKIIEPGNTYQVVLSGVHGKAVSDVSDSFFAIRQCQ